MSLPYTFNHSLVQLTLLLLYSINVNDGQRALAWGGHRVRREVNRAIDRICHRLRAWAFQLHLAGWQEIPHWRKMEHVDRLSKVTVSKHFQDKGWRMFKSDFSSSCNILRSILSLAMLSSFPLPRKGEQQKGTYINCCLTCFQTLVN